MAVLERRFQILLDEARYQRVADEAERSNRSVAAVIREAVDLRFPDSGDRDRASAAAALLDLIRVPSADVGEGPGQLKEAYAAVLAAKAGA